MQFRDSDGGYPSQSGLLSGTRVGSTEHSNSRAKDHSAPKNIVWLTTMSRSGLCHDHTRPVDALGARIHVRQRAGLAFGVMTRTLNSSAENFLAAGDLGALRKTHG